VKKLTFEDVKKQWNGWIYIESIDNWEKSITIELDKYVYPTPDVIEINNFVRQNFPKSIYKAWYFANIMGEDGRPYWIEPKFYYHQLFREK
jgi:hypothetical protein